MLPVRACVYYTPLNSCVDVDNITISMQSVRTRQLLNSIYLLIRYKPGFHTAPLITYINRERERESDGVSMYYMWKAASALSLFQ